jgi:galactokinase
MRSEAEEEPAVVDLDVPLSRQALLEIEPPWARRVAGIVASVRPETGGTVLIRSNLPVGAGLSSSAALQVALSLALGYEGDALGLAVSCQRAEHAATGMPSGIMDQLVSAAGVEGSALLIDFAKLEWEPVALPGEAEIIVVHSGEKRTLDQTGYRARCAECEAASFHLGALGTLGAEAVLGLPDPLLRRRARHVVTECDRVRWFAEAVRAGDLAEAGRLMLASHASLARDFEVSTPALDALVEKLSSLPGVYGARLTGGGFGGCVVALAAPGALDTSDFPTPAWKVRPSAGALRKQPN